MVRPAGDEALTEPFHAKLTTAAINKTPRLSLSTKTGSHSMKVLTAAAFGMVLLSTAARADSAEGTWLSEDGGTKVRVVDCGGKLCGTVVWLDHPIDRETGKPKTDKRNPDPAKRSRPLIGLQVVSGMTPSGPNKWSGKVYNADDGHTYSAHFQLKSQTVATLQGCVLGILCKGHTWKRSN
jgi:uncharacterized protein (DUF2147 family)